MKNSLSKKAWLLIVLAAIVVGAGVGVGMGIVGLKHASAPTTTSEKPR